MIDSLKELSSFYDLSKLSLLFINFNHRFTENAKNLNLKEFVFVNQDLENINFGRGFSFIVINGKITVEEAVRLKRFSNRFIFFEDNNILEQFNFSKTESFKDFVVYENSASLMNRLLEDNISSKDTVLDLGCGIGLPVKDLIAKKIIGLDAYNYKDKYPFKFIQQNITDLSNFKDKSFNVVLMIDIIEHLEKKKGLSVLEQGLRICKKCLILYTPKEWDDNHKAVEDKKYWSFGNKYNYHRSLWKEEDFKKYGFKVYSVKNGIFSIFYKKFK